jgi:hypothetical protein
VELEEMRKELTDTVRVELILGKRWCRLWFDCWTTEYRIFVNKHQSSCTGLSVHYIEETEILNIHRPSHRSRTT